jgi:hypothetical protein
MHSWSDVIACFDAIRATQEQDRDEHLLVFVDEINAQLQPGSAYGAFLAPLEDGAYMHGGKTFRLDPCAWVFAGTGDPCGQDVDKGSDFVSRLSLGLVTLSRPCCDGAKAAESGPFRERLWKTQALEKVHIGPSMLRAEFREVRYMSEHALRAFWPLSLEVRVRDIRYFVERFHGIQYGRVMSSNVPSE